MPTEKPRYTITLDEEMLKKIDDFRFENRFPNRTQATLELIRIGMEALEKQQEEQKKMIKYKIDILSKLKELGYSTYQLKKDSILNANTIQYLREDKLIGLKNLDIICQLLECQPGDLIEYVSEDPMA